MLASKRVLGTRLQSSAHNCYVTDYSSKDPTQSVSSVIAIVLCLCLHLHIRIVDSILINFHCTFLISNLLLRYLLPTADDSSQGSTINGDDPAATIDTLFTVEQRDDYTAHFRTGRNLKGFYGTWAVQIEVRNMLH